MPATIRINCAEVLGDHLEVEPVPAGDLAFADVPCVVLRAYNHMAERNEAIALDEDGARQLFNWLGVWLHEYRS